MTMEALIKAALVAPNERRALALQVLRGEIEVRSGSVRPEGAQLLTMRRGAEFLGVSRATLWRLIHAGRIPTMELTPGTRRLRRADLEAFVDGGKPTREPEERVGRESGR
jgi:excisionase family DNA binding protein